MEARYFDGPEGRLHYLEGGEEEGPALVLLHGVTGHARYWEAVWIALSSDYHLYALDFRGHGESAHASAYPYEGYGADLRAFLAHAGLVRPVLVGHSLGAYVSLWHVANGGEASALVTVDMRTGLGPEEYEAASKAAERPQPVLPDMKAVLDRLRLIMGDGTASDARLMQIGRDGVRPAPGGGVQFVYDRRVLALPPYRPYEFASQVRVPVLVTYGTRSIGLGAGEAEGFAMRLPDAELLAIEGAGHHPHLDQPEVLATAIADFLERRLR